LCALLLIPNAALGNLTLQSLENIASPARYSREWATAPHWRPSCIHFTRNPAATEDSTMGYTIDFAGVASAIFVSFAVALGLEWLSLVLMMRLMPARPAPQTVRQRARAQAQAQDAAEPFGQKAA
jgi:hypothetical protein